MKQKLLIGGLDELEAFRVTQFSTGTWKVTLEKKDGNSVTIPFDNKVDCVNAVREAWS